MSAPQGLLELEASGALDMPGLISADAYDNFQQAIAVMEQVTHFITVNHPGFETWNNDVKTKYIKKLQNRFKQL